MIGSLQTFRSRLRKWYLIHQRELPWRLPRNANPAAALDPYHVLVSEAMLQQTQVATVIPYFHRFIELFPTVQALADAPQASVLRAWQGLGYYSRARNLQKAAAVIVRDFNGQVPDRVDQLLQLPGVGRYTAGAVASLAFGKSAAILDGNVIRVLCRLDAVTDDPRDPVVRELLWARSAELLPARHLGDFNSSLMELGALVCTPRSPRCLTCPVRTSCSAFNQGITDRIPPPRVRTQSPLLRRQSFFIHHQEHVLIEQRPASGRWASLWQLPTIEATDAAISPALLQSSVGVSVAAIQPAGLVQHTLTHRRYQFELFVAAADKQTPQSHRLWVKWSEIDRHALSRPQQRMVEMAFALLKEAKALPKPS